MNDRRPAPGTPWALHCHDAFPREWLDGSGSLPEGFTRPADQWEADLICGRITESVFLAKTGRSIPPSLPSPQATQKRKLSPVMRKLLGTNRFLDALAKHEPRLSPLAVAIWCWMWRCEKDGLATTSERKLADRFGRARDTIRRAIHELETLGYLSLHRRGVHGHSASVYRVHTTPASGRKTGPVPV